MKYYLGVTLLALVIPLTYANSMTVEQLDTAYEKANQLGNDQQAYIYLKQAATAGNPDAICRLGEAFQTGRYGTTDLSHAIGLLNQAAKLGSVRAKTALGMSYLKGLGVTQNNRLATKWFKQAAMSGDMKAPRYLGVLAEQQGLYKKALSYYLQAAQKGDITSQYNVGRFYETGLGVAVNYQTALQWYTLSAKRGDIIAAPAMMAIGHLYETGMGVPKDLSQAQVWSQKAVQTGYKQGQSS